MPEVKRHTAARFKVGDICIIKQRLCHHKLSTDVRIGQEVTILSIDLSDPRGLIYEVDIPSDGFAWPYYWARECYLELKRPPREEVGTWDHCVWQPEVEYG